MRNALMAAMVAGAASIAAADQITITFDEGSLAQGELVTTQFEDLGVVFSGDLINSINIVDLAFEQPEIDDLGGFLNGGNGDDDLVAPDGLGLGVVSASIRFEAVEGTALTNLSFDLLRFRDQDITITVEFADGSTQAFDFAAPGFGGLTTYLFPVTSQTLNAGGALISSVEIHNHGGRFGINNLSFESVSVAIPLPGAAAMAGLGLAGLAVRRRRLGA